MNKWIKNIINKISAFRSEKVEETFNPYTNEIKSLNRLPVYFNSIIIKEKTPANNTIQDNEFIQIIYNEKACWALFRCPCGCKNVISLSLQKSHDPNWKVYKSENNRPTIYPSVWQSKGCYSHFWVEDGKIIWCRNSGIEPWIAEPNYYTKP